MDILGSPDGLKLTSVAARSWIWYGFSVKGFKNAPLFCQVIILALVTLMSFFGALVSVHNLCTFMSAIRLFAHFFDLNPKQIKLYPQG